MFKVLIFTLLIFNFLFALTEQQIADRSWQIRVGKGDNLKALSVNEKKKDILPPLVQTKSGKVIYKIDYSNAIILNKIVKYTKPIESSTKAKSINLLALPKTYISDINSYQQIKNRINKNKNALQKQQKKTLLLLAKCKTFEDFKINNNSRIKMLCKSKEGKRFMLFAKLEMSFNKKPFLIGKPYMFEDVNGNIQAVESDKSALYNAINGSMNLATYVDKKALEKVSKAMATTVGGEVPKMSDDYISKKNASDSTVIQTDTSTTTATTTPKPNIVDYGFSLLAKVLSSGIKAGAEQLYHDLGYIYFIPKNSVIDAEISYSVYKKK